MNKLNYIYSESTEKPLGIEVGLSCVYLRQNIQTVTREDVEYYTFEEATLTIDEFNEYANTLAAVNAVKGVNNADNINRILDGQSVSDSNTLTIMEAIADLYLQIASVTM